MSTQTLELLSPCFCGGANGKEGDAELRIPSIRGQLRYWLRIVCHDKDYPNTTTKKEHAVFGGIRGRALGFHVSAKGGAVVDSVASRVALETSVMSPLGKESYPMCPHKTGTDAAPRNGLSPDQSFHLSWQLLLDDAAVKSDFLCALKAWVLLGGLGARSNRAAGSIWRKNWKPTEADFLKLVKSLWGGNALPDYLRVKVLRLLTQEELDNYKPESKRSGWGSTSCDDPMLLRTIATDTLQLGNDCGGALGFGGPNGRKASPLKLKIGHFSDGHRLIAVLDKRNNRDGDIACAVKRLQAVNKPLGLLLAEAKIG